MLGDIKEIREFQRDFFIEFLFEKFKNVIMLKISKLYQISITTPIKLSDACSDPVCARVYPTPTFIQSSLCSGYTL